MWSVTTIDCVISVSNTCTWKGYQHLCWPFKVFLVWSVLRTGYGLKELSDQHLLLWQQLQCFALLGSWCCSKLVSSSIWSELWQGQCQGTGAVRKEYGDTLEHSFERSLLLQVWASFGLFHLCASWLQRGLSRAGLTEHRDSRDTAAVFCRVREAKLCQVNANYFLTIT